MSSSEPGWGSGWRGSWGPRGCASWGWTWRGLEHGRGCAGGRRGAGPSRWRLRTGDGVRHQRLLFDGWRRRRRWRVMCARRSLVVRGGLSIFDPLETNTATLQDTQTDRQRLNHSDKSSFQRRLQIKMQRVFVQNQ